MDQSNKGAEKPRDAELEEADGMFQHGMCGQSLHESKSIVIVHISTTEEGVHRFG